MKCKTPQDLLDTVGFIVLAYWDSFELERDLQAKIINGSSINSSIPEESKVVVIGEATREEWVNQCVLCDEPAWRPGESEHIGFLKVAAE